MAHFCRKLQLAIEELRVETWIAAQKNCMVKGKELKNLGQLFLRERFN